MNTQKPVLLFYCQHSLGMGHLVRSLTLATTFAEFFRVVFLNGGRFPENTKPPLGVDVLNLPPLGMDENNLLYSQDAKYSLSEAHALRRRMIFDAFNHYQPSVIFIELFPFGRKKFAGELMPLLKAAKRHNPKPLVVCSLRDIMVNARKDQQRHDDRARWLVDRYFDGILVHSDPQFARLEESFKPSRQLATSVYYTGFVLPSGASPEKRVRQKQVLVSAGGGMVGMPLFEIAVKAQRVLWKKIKIPMTLVAGPFLPEHDWMTLAGKLEGCPGLTLHRYVPDMTGLLSSHSVSVSQCGYNTVMDILKSNIPALVVPFFQGQEDEQTNRARRLAELGLLRTVAADQLNVHRFVAEVEQLLEFQPKATALDFNGAIKSLDLISKQAFAQIPPMDQSAPNSRGMVCV